MWRKCIEGLAISLAVVAVFPVAAATSASARVTGLTFELIDLDLNDGVAASMTWSELAAMSQVNNRFGQVFELFPQPDGSVTWGVSFEQAGFEFGSSDIDFSSSAAFADGGAATSTSGTGVVTQASTVLGGQSLTTEAYLFGGFELSAHTELRLTGLMQSSISGSGSADALMPDGVDMQTGVPFSQASTFMEVALGEYSFNQSLSGLNYTPSTHPDLFSVDGYTSSAESSFTLGWRNDSGEAQTGYFSLFAQTASSQLSESSPVTPVPEPATWALMAMGVLAVGAARRKQHSG